MKAGDKIRVQHYIFGHSSELTDHVVEEFRYCLGIFLSEQARTMNEFTPLCDMYERGPESKNAYMPNCGEYYTNPVQAWMDIP